ncbi:unnamed protein product [Phytophthora fragariaefolia]|uniref:ATP-dependent DNA helicase n=1 Tax=Phytophthora fragariaefolia TaxID=1490495 RepID=A0A9W6WVE8_9STRA|nr:unnamed protein product [Phytophthora fragariaefolia]
MGGRTAHSNFKIPLKLDEKSVCSIHKQSKLKKLFQEANLIIWDEAPMTHRHAFEAVDRSSRRPEQRQRPVWWKYSGSVG